MTHDQLQMHEIDPLLGRRFLVRKRDGRLAEFNEARILLAIESAFKAHHGVGQNDPLPEAAQSAVKTCADKVVEQVLSRAVRGEELEVERIQDAVENQLMLAGHLEVVRCYILYRDLRRRTRTERDARADDSVRNKEIVTPAAPRPGEEVAASTRLMSIYGQALPKSRAGEATGNVGRRHFDCYLNEGDYLRCLTPALLDFESELLARGLRWERDAQLAPAGLEMLYDRFLAHENGRRFETPQYFWMRIAMGLALAERTAAEAHALRFYEALSNLRFIPSEAILSHAGTPHPALIGFEEAPGDGDGDRLEIWHRNVLDLLEEPSADFNKGLWIPDLFMKRLQQHGQWTLLDPAEAAELNHCHGAVFESRYRDYELKAGRGQIGFARQTSALDLWQGVMESTLKTGQPGIVFKDAVHMCAPQFRDQACSGIGRTRPSGAVNLAAHVREGGLGLDVGLLRETITAAVRMLDNAIEVSAYSSDRMRAASFENRAIGLGIVGFDETLARLQISPGSAAAADFADWSAELVSHCAILASAQLARERGLFPGYAGSRWSDGILPMDALTLLSKERGLAVNLSASASQDWEPVREMIRTHGLRNGVIMTTDPLNAPAKIAGVAPAPADTEGDLLLSIECAARRQKWSDVDQTLTLQMRNDTTDPGFLHMQAWEKGISRIHPRAPARETMRSVVAAAPQAEALATVGGQVL
jgi:ribonucleotide reductase alpha subunit